MNTIKIDGNLIIGLAISAAAAIGIYKLAKIGIEADKRNEEARLAFMKEKEEIISSKNFDTKIDIASLRNDALEPDDRRYAYDILCKLRYSMREAATQDNFDHELKNLERYIDIFNRKDPKEMRAVIDIYLTAKEEREIATERQHELAVAKAAGNIELEKAKIAANAETSKAKLYSSSIDTAVKIGKEFLRNERKQESNN